MAKEAEKAMEIQEVIEESENDSDYKAETSHLTIQEESENDFNCETEDSHMGALPEKSSSETFFIKIEIFIAL